MFFFHKIYLERTCDGFFSHLKIEFITIIKSWIFYGVLQHYTSITIPSKGFYQVSKPEKDIKPPRNEKEGRGNAISIFRAIDKVFIRPVRKNIFLEFSKMPGSFILHVKQMLEKVFCSNIVP